MLARVCGGIAHPPPSFKAWGEYPTVGRMPLDARIHLPRLKASVHLPSSRLLHAKQGFFPLKVCFHQAGVPPLKRCAGLAHLIAATAPLPAGFWVPSTRRGGQLRGLRPASLPPFVRSRLRGVLPSSAMLAGRGDAACWCTVRGTYACLKARPLRTDSAQAYGRCGKHMPDGAAPAHGQRAHARPLRHGYLRPGPRWSLWGWRCQRKSARAHMRALWDWQPPWGGACACACARACMCTYVQACFERAHARKHALTCGKSVRCERWRLHGIGRFALWRGQSQRLP